METKIVIENGEVTMDALNGQGEECRLKHGPYLRRLAAEFGISTDVVEKVKPEMHQSRQTSHLEGDKLV